MPRHRVVLLTLAVLALLPAVYLATKDVRFHERACGTALFTSDPNKGQTLTGNREDDDLQQQIYSSSCAHRILAQRFMAFVPAAIAFALWLAAMRWQPRDRIPGDSVI
jgi:hypothetical protein